jgi:hypothetical protein
MDVARGVARTVRIPLEPEGMFPKPLREYLRDGLEQLAPTLFPKVASEFLQREPYCRLPKEVQDKISSQFREVVHPVVMDFVIAEMGPYLDNLQQSLERIQKLVVASTAMSSDVGADALRASVVLLHASLEDFLRTMAQSLLPQSNESCLNEIPLVGLGARKEKFFLGRLARHRGKLVDEVLKESVAEYLEHSNYNSTQEIAILLETLGFNVAEHARVFTVLDQMIVRRHQIVHRADKTKDSGSETYVLQPIQAADVRGWAAAVAVFIVSVLPSLALKVLTPEKAIDVARAFMLKRQAGEAERTPDSSAGTTKID